MDHIPKLTLEGHKEGTFVGLIDGGEVSLGGVGDMLGDLLGLSDGEVEGDCNKIIIIFEVSNGVRQKVLLVDVSCPQTHL